MIPWKPPSSRGFGGSLAKCTPLENSSLEANYLEGPGQIPPCLWSDDIEGAASLGLVAGERLPLSRHTLQVSRDQSHGGEGSSGDWLVYPARWTLISDVSLPCSGPEDVVGGALSATTSASQELLPGGNLPA